MSYEVNEPPVGLGPAGTYQPRLSGRNLATGDDPILSLLRTGEVGSKDNVLAVAGDGDLLSYDFLMGLAARINDLGLSRRDTATWLYVRLSLWRGKFTEFNCDPFLIKDSSFDRAYSLDSEHEWNTNVKRFVKRPPVRRPKSTMLLRFKLWDLAFKVHGDPILLPTY